MKCTCGYTWLENGECGHSRNDCAKMPVGIGNKPFKIVLDPECWAKNDVITMDKYPDDRYQVVKVYKIRWYHKVALWLGFSIKVFKGVKVKPIDNGKEEAQ